MRQTYKIFDWTGVQISNIEFEDFESAWGWIYEKFDDVDSAYDDLFVLIKWSH